VTTETTTATTTSSAEWSPALAMTARFGWFMVWAFLTAFAWFEVIEHGYANGAAVDSVVLTATAVGAFILPDLTFLIGASHQVERGYLPVRAVPFYNAMHRFVPPLVLTTFVGVVFDPLGTVGLAIFVGGLSWMAHVAMDRAAGYGMRNDDGSR
jgi:hypothetical protein